MAIWLTVLRAIPWAAILANGPGIARAAERAVSGARKNTAADASSEMTALAGRLKALESHQLEMSEVLRQMAEQNERLTVAADILASRLRWMTIAAIAAAALAIASLALVIAQR